MTGPRESAGAKIKTTPKLIAITTFPRNVILSGQSGISPISTNEVTHFVNNGR